MRFVIALLAIVPAVLCQLQPENQPRPSIAQYTTIAGICDAATGIIEGASFAGRQGTLKACAAACLALPNCKGLNLVTDEAKCQLFREECANARVPGRNEPAQNFYLRGEIACGASTVGNEFVLAFMANRVAQPVNMSLEIWLTQDKEVGGSTVKLITDASQGLARDVPVPYKQAVSTLLPFTWKVTDVDAGVTIEKKAIYLQSEVDFVFYGVNKEFFTADAFLGVPVRALGTRYIANWLAAMQTIYPHRWIGRFSFTTPNGTSYCSATAISGNNIVTAAHCVYDTPSRNAFYTNKVFTPAYRNGNAPYGSFATTNCSVLTAWVNLSGAYSINSWAPYDVAVCTVGTNAAGQTLNQVVGSAGKAWNYGYTRHIFNLGYPLIPPIDRHWPIKILAGSGQEQ